MRIKSHHEIHAQRERMFRSTMRLMTAACRRAHPETGGNSLLVHNWGNPASKAAEVRYWARWRRIEAALDARYAAAEHTEHHAHGFRPLWCAVCTPSQKSA